MTVAHDLHSAQPATPPLQVAQAGRVDGAIGFRRWFSGAAELTHQLGLILAAVLLYFAVRGLTEGNVEEAVNHSLNVLAFEQRLGLDVEHWAQNLIIDHHWLISIANWIYIWGHWPVIATTLIWLHQTRRYDYLMLRNAMFISGAIGLVIFATYAVAPPRLADIGLIDTVTSHSNAYRVLQPPSLANKYAALPSLHVGWNFLVGIAFFQATTNRVIRTFALVSPPLMAIAVIVTANHYLDGVAGLIVAYTGLRVSALITRRLVAVDRRLSL